MTRFKVGVQLWPQHCTVAELRDAWKAADDQGVDSIWVWDHFFPLFGPDEGGHFEGWTLLAAMAADTSHAAIGTLVTGTGYRNPDLLADMARTVDHLSGGRAYLGIGSGWFERDYDEYGYEFGTAGGRLRQLETDLGRIRARLGRLTPGPIGRLPLLIGGSGEKVTLRLVAEHADAWNTFGPAESWAAKNRVLDDWCGRLGRQPAEIERTVSYNQASTGVGQGPEDEFHRDVEACVAAGATHVILGRGEPFDLGPVRRLLELAAG